MALSFVDDSAEQVAVLFSIDRSNHKINPMLSADTREEIAANFTHNINEGSVLYIDSSWSYVAIRYNQIVTIND